MKTFELRQCGHLLAQAAALVLVIISVCGVSRGQTPWSTPDPSNNINNTNSGNVGIGTTTPGSKLDVNGNVYVRDLVGTGTQHLLYGYLNGAGRMIFDLYSRDQVGVLDLSLGDGSISTRLNGYGHSFFNGGNVGIGTASPAQKLDVAGAIQSQSLFLNSGAYSGSMSWGNNSYASWYMTGSGATSSIRFKTWDGSNYSDKVTFENGGNVGIGTASPAQKLDVAGIIQSQSLFLNSGAYSGSMSWGNNGHANWYMTGSGATSSIRFKTWDGSNYSDKVTFENGGNVGIGTATPAYKLDVAGEIRSSTGGFRFPDGTIQTTAASAGDAVSSVFGRTGAVVAATNDYTWAQINKSTSSLADLTTRSASDLSSGTLPDARFPATLPPASGVNLTSLNASNLASGTVATARLGSGTANGTTFLRGDNTWAAPSGATQWSNGTNAIYYNDGTVGIGTTNPANTLTVKTTMGFMSSSDTVRMTIAGSESANTIETSGGTNLLLNSSGSLTHQAASGFTVNTGGSSERLRIDPSGNVGIGTPTPGTKLQVAGGDISVDPGYGIRKAGDNWIIGYSSSLPGIAIGSGSGTDQVNITAGGYERLRILANGNVGIGKTNPEAALDVVGDIKASGVIHAKYQDVAEWVESSEKLAAGTVVVLDSTKSNQVISSSVSYDTRVAGVISERPGLALGEKGEGKVLVATTGRVKIKVDAGKSPIRIGDLLVTSDIPGIAMKSEPVELAGRKMHMPGTLIGKALEPLAKGKGEILVLLSLQ